MPIKKPESFKKEVKKPKRTPVDISALLTPSTCALSSYTSSTILRPQTKSAPVLSTPLPPTNQWNERTGADLFVNPRTRLFNSGLDFEDEMEIVLAESLKSAEQEDRLRNMYYEQHLASQVLEQRPEFSHEPPPKDIPFSYRSNSCIYYDDSSEAHHNNLQDSQEDNSSSDEWQPVLNKSSAKVRESLKSLKSGAKMLEKSEKKKKEAKEVSVTKEEESEISMGAVPKTKHKKSKKEAKKEVDFATIVETKLSEPQYPPKLQREKKPKSNHKSRSTTSVETRLHNLGIDNDFGCDESATIDSNNTNCQVNYVEPRNFSDTHAFKDEEDCEVTIESANEHYDEDNHEDQYDSEAETGINDGNHRVHEFRTSPEPYTPKNNEHSEFSDEDYNDEDYSSEIETENYDFYPEISHVTRNSHPELFDPNNFVNYYGSFEDDEFLPLLKNLPSPIVKHTYKSYQNHFPRPKISLSKFKDILETVQSDLKSDSGSPGSCRQASVLKEQEDQSSSSERNKASIQSTDGKDLQKRPRLPGSGRLKIPLLSPESFNNQVSKVEKLQRILSGAVSDDLTENDMSAAPVRLKSELTDSLKFSPSLEPISEGKGASSIESHKNLNDNHSSEQDFKEELKSSTSSAVVLPDGLIEALAQEIKKLNIPDDNNLRTAIQKMVDLSLQDPESSLSKLLCGQGTEMNVEVPIKPTETVTSNFSSQDTPLQSADDCIKPIPFNQCPSDSLLSADQIPDSADSKYLNNNSIFQMTPQSPKNSFDHPFHQMAVNHQTSNSYSDQFTPQNVACNSAIPPTLNSSNYFSRNLEMVDQASIVPPLSEEAIINILKQTIVTEAGEVGILFMNSVNFLNELPILVKTIQSQAINCANQEFFVQSLAREYLLRSEFFSPSQPPPGFIVQNQHQASTSGSFPYSNLQEYPNMPQYTGVPSSQGAPYVISSFHNSVPADLYSPGLSVPNVMHSQIHTNINT